MIIGLPSPTSTVTLTDEETAEAVSLSVALAVSTRTPVVEGVQEKEYGDVVSSPNKVSPSKNSTLVTEPDTPPTAISVAVAVILIGIPGRTATPSAGAVMFTTGGGLASTLEAPVTTKEKAWVLVVNVPSKDTVTM
jgi:hypothetical protein